MVVRTCLIILRRGCRSRDFNDLQRGDQQSAIRCTNALQSVPSNLCYWDVDVAYWKPAIQLDEESAVVVREPGSTADPAPQTIN